MNDRTSQSPGIEARGITAAGIPRKQGAATGITAPRIVKIVEARAAVEAGRYDDESILDKAIRRMYRQAGDQN